MAASFVTLSGKDLFKRGSGGSSHLIKVPEIDNLVSAGGLAVFDNISVQLGETMQFFMTFDDVIKYIHFGKSLGNITVGGTLFSDCRQDMPGLSQLLTGFQALRGKTITISIGGKGFTCVVTNININIVSEPDTMAAFQVVFAVVNHEL